MKRSPITSSTKQWMKRSKTIIRKILKFKSKKDLAHTISIRSQNFSRRDWNHLYLHNQSMRTPRKKPCIITQNKRDLRPLHFETQRKHNKWPFKKKINCDCKLPIVEKQTIEPYHGSMKDQNGT